MLNHLAKHTKQIVLIVLLLAISVICLFLINSRKRISGVVVDDNGTIGGAVVRIQTTEIFTISDNNGRFILNGFSKDEDQYITAWAEGFYISGVSAEYGREVVIHLEAHNSYDNPDYHWLSSTYYPGEGENQGCAECHSSVGTDLGLMLPVDEWLLDAHSHSATNERFLSMYSGQDLKGNKSPVTKYDYNRDYGYTPLRPSKDQPYFGPGYKLDFPGSAGNCASCHVPLAAVNKPYDADPTKLTGVEKEGVSCDFCHKIWDVKLDENGIPFPNMPGVLSLELRRPTEERQLFIGPLDDVAPFDDTYSPIQSKSEVCASCHFGIFWDIPVYNSFGEWKESVYSDPVSGQSCQDCHMKPTGTTQFARSEKGGLIRNPETIFSHRMPGAGDEILLQNAVTMKVKAEIEEDQILVNVTITNDNTGHHIPTDSPLRQLILLVDAALIGSDPLTLIDGPVIPEWAGVGDSAAGYYGGKPGTGYAKILQEMWTGITPSGAYWNPTRIISDNRIAALESDSTNYIFQGLQSSGVPKNSSVSVKVKLLYRRAFIELMDQKDWDIADIVMEEEELLLKVETFLY